MKQRILNVLSQLSLLSSADHDLNQINGAASALPVLYQVGHGLRTIVGRIAELIIQPLADELATLRTGTGPVATMYRQQRAIEWALNGAARGKSRKAYDEETETWIKSQTPLRHQVTQGYRQLLEGLVPNTGQLYERGDGNLWLDAQPTPQALLDMVAQWADLTTVALSFDTESHAWLWEGLTSTHDDVSLTARLHLDPLVDENGKKCLGLSLSYGNGSNVKARLWIHTYSNQDNKNSFNPLNLQSMTEPEWNDLATFHSINSGALGIADMSASVYSGLEGVSWPGPWQNYIHPKAFRLAMTCFLSANGYHHVTSSAVEHVDDASAFYVWWSEVEASQGSLDNLCVYTTSQIISLAGDGGLFNWRNYNMSVAATLNDSETPEDQDVKTGAAFVLKFNVDGHGSYHFIAMIRVNDLTCEATFSLYKVHNKEAVPIRATGPTITWILDKMKVARAELVAEQNAKNDD